MGMANTMYFMNCKDCDNCQKSSFGHYCDKHFLDIDNTEVDGCTWGDKKKDGERREGE